jgi:predicted HD phosphohydrolase
MGVPSGYRITRLEHCLQSATRAHRAGEDEETVVSALLHDIEL